jgi:hypothetical protein
VNYLPRLASNCHLPDLYFLSAGIIGMYHYA